VRGEDTSRSIDHREIEGLNAKLIIWVRERLITELITELITVADLRKDSKSVPLLG